MRLTKDLPKPKDFLGPAGIEEGRAVFGPPLVGLPMVMAPTNEDGVNFLFGWMAQKLGFLVLRMQSPFPDCIAMRRVDDETWQLVVIELEYESRNFIAHGHDPSKVDLIVCWKHNWEDCPVEVVELSRFFEIG